MTSNMKRKFEEEEEEVAPDAGVEESKESPKIPASDEEKKAAAGRDKDVVEDAAKDAPSLGATVASKPPGTPPPPATSSIGGNNARTDEATSASMPPVGHGSDKALLDAHYFSPPFINALMQLLLLKQDEFSRKVQAVGIHQASFERIRTDVNGFISLIPQLARDPHGGADILQEGLYASYMNVCYSLRACVAVATEEGRVLAEEIHELSTFLSMVMNVREQQGVAAGAGAVAGVNPQDGVAISPDLLARQQQQMAVLESPYEAKGSSEPAAKKPKTDWRDESGIEKGDEEKNPEAVDMTAGKSA